MRSSPGRLFQSNLISFSHRGPSEQSLNGVRVFGRWSIIKYSTALFRGDRGRQCGDPRVLRFFFEKTSSVRQNRMSKQTQRGFLACLTTVRCKGSLNIFTNCSFIIPYVKKYYNNYTIFMFLNRFMLVMHNRISQTEKCYFSSRAQFF